MIKKKFLILGILIIGFLPNYSYAWVNSRDLNLKKINLSFQKSKQNKDVIKYKKGEALVKFKSNISKDEILNVITQYNLQIIKYIKGIDVYHLKVAKNKSVKEIVKALNKDKRIKYAEPNFIYHALSQDLSSQFGNIGLDSALDYLRQVAALLGISLDELLKDVPVGVVDSGVMPHTDITNTLDGYDFVDNDSNPEDSIYGIGHGTHVAGIITTLSNGMAQIMPVRVLNARGSGSAEQITSGIRWATDHGVKVINLSLGSVFPSRTILEAIKYAIDKGVLVVTAAGNSGQLYNGFPASFWGVLSVAATAGDTKTGFSTYNPSVGIAAPGYQILSTYFNNSYRYFNGTSMASPVVAGTASLIFSLDNKLTANEVMMLLQKSTDNIDSKNPEYAGILGTGLINVERAIKSAHIYSVLRKIYDELSKYNFQIDEEGRQEMIQKIENLISQLPEGNKLSQGAIDFIMSSLENEQYLTETGKIKWLLEIYARSEMQDTLAPAVATFLESMEPKKIAEVLKNYPGDKLKTVFNLLNPKFAAQVLAEADTDFIADVLSTLYLGRNSITILSYLAGLSDLPSNLVPGLEEYMKQLGLLLQGVGDPKGPKIDLSNFSEEDFNQLVAKLKETNPEMATVLGVFKAIANESVNFEEIADKLKNLTPEIISIILERINPEKAEKILAKLDDDLVVDIFKNSTMLLANNLREYFDRPEFVNKVMKNLPAEEIARLLFFNKINTSDSILFIINMFDNLSAEKAAEVLDNYYKMILKASEKDNTIGAGDHIAVIIKYVLKNHSKLNQDKIDAIRDELIKINPELGKFWQAFELVLGNEEIDISKVVEIIQDLEPGLFNYFLFAFRHTLPDLPLKILKSIPEEKLLSIYSNLGFLQMFKSMDSMSMDSSEEGKEEFAQFCTPLLVKAFIQEYKNTTDIIKRKTLIEKTLNLFSRHIGNESPLTLESFFTELLKYADEDLIINIFKDIDRFDQMLNLASTYFNIKNETLPQEVLSYLREERPDWYKMAELLITLKTKLANNQDLVKEDFDMLKDIYDEYGEPIIASIISQLGEGNHIIKILNSLYKYHKEIYDELLEKYNFIINIINADLDSELKTFLSHLSTEQLLEVYDRLIKDELYHEENKKNEKVKEVKDKIEYVKTLIGEKSPGILELKELLESKLDREREFTPFTPDEIQRIEELFDKMGPELFWKSVLYSMTDVKVIVNLLNKIKPEILETLFTAVDKEAIAVFLNAAASPGGKDPKEVFDNFNKLVEIFAQHDPKFMAEILVEMVKSPPTNEISLNNDSFYMIFSALSKIDAELADRVKEEFIELIKGDETLKEDPNQMQKLIYQVEHVTEASKFLVNLMNEESLSEEDIGKLIEYCKYFQNEGMLQNFMNLFMELIPEKFDQFLKGIKDPEFLNSLTNIVAVKGYIYNFLMALGKKEEIPDEDLNLVAKVLHNVENDEVLMQSLFLVATQIKNPDVLDALTTRLETMNDNIKANMLKVISCVVRNSSPWEKGVQTMYVTYFHAPTNFPKVNLSEDDVKAIENLYDALEEENPGSGVKMLSQLFFPRQLGSNFLRRMNPEALAKILLDLRINIVEKLLNEDKFSGHILNTLKIDSWVEIIKRLSENGFSAEKIANILQKAYVDNTNQGSPIKDSFNKLALIMVALYKNNPQLFEDIQETLKEVNSQLAKVSILLKETVDLIDNLNGEINPSDLSSIKEKYQNIGAEVFAQLLIGYANPNTTFEILTSFDSEETEAIMDKMDMEYLTELLKSPDIDISKKAKIFSLMGNKKAIEFIYHVLENDKGFPIQELKQTLQADSSTEANIKLDILTAVKFIFSQSVKKEEEKGDSKAIGGGSKVIGGTMQGSKLGQPEIGASKQEYTFPEFDETQIDSIVTALDNLYQEEDSEIIATLLMPKERKVNPEVLSAICQKIDKSVLSDLLLNQYKFTYNLFQSEINPSSLADVMMRLNSENVAKIFHDLYNPREAGLDMKEVVELGGGDIESKLVRVFVNIYLKDKSQDKAFSKDIIEKLKEKSPNLAELLVNTRDMIDFLAKTTEPDIETLKDYYQKLKDNFAAVLTLIATPETCVDILSKIDPAILKDVLVNQTALSPYIIDSDLTANSIAQIFLRKQEEQYIFDPHSIAKTYSSVYHLGIDVPRILDIQNEILNQDQKFANDIMNALQGIDSELYTELTGENPKDIHNNKEQALPTIPDFLPNNGCNTTPIDLTPSCQGLFTN